MHEKYNLLEKRFGKWTVLSRAPSNKFQDAYWYCKCDCGKEKRVKGSFLRRGCSTNCGCVRNRKLKDQNQLEPGEAAVRQLYNTYSQGARFKNKPFELSLDEFKALTKGNCYYCGIPPCQKVVRYHNKNKTPGTPYEYNGIDRLDSSLGYTIDNCVSCCGVHNKMKLDMTPEKFLSACLSVVEYYGKGRDTSNPAPIQ